MEKNCLITKLKGSITGDAPIFGHLEMIMKAGLYEKNLSQYVSAQPNDEIIVSGDNGIVFKKIDSNTELSNPFTLTTRYGFNVNCDTDSKMVITNKYKLRALQNGEYGFTGVKEFIGGIDSFIYSIPNDATSVMLRMYQSKIELSEYVQKVTARNSSIVTLNIKECPLVEGNINTFRNISNLKSIDVGSCPRVNGTIADLKSITTIENIACTGTQISGTIEEFVAGQRAAGRTTGTVTGNSAGWGKVTFDGATTHAKGAVSWTATTITMDGVTINS